MPTQHQIQTAVLIPEVGQPAILAPHHPIPQPGAGQVQVQVKVAALNPHDHKIRDQGLLIRDNPHLLPWIPGSDVVGTVSALGPGITATGSKSSAQFEIGDRIMFFAASHTQAGLQQYALTDVGGTCCKVPSGMSDDDAATLPTNLNSVFVAMFVMLGIRVPWISEGEGEVPEALLVVGGGSNCGRLAVQLARLAGVGRVVVVGGRQEELRGMGAAEVVDRHLAEEEIVRKAREIVGDELRFAIDTVNGPDGLGVGFGALSSSKKGKLARLVPRGVIGEEVKKGHELFDVVGGGKARDPLCLAMWERLPAWIEEGKIKPTGYYVAGRLDAATVNEALDRYRDGDSKGQPHVHVA